VSLRLGQSGTTEKTKMNRRQFFSRALSGVAAAGAASPALAQDMGNNGFVLPGFFFSRPEEIARSNCINELPSCRASVRQRLDLERSISLIAPWFLLAVAMAGYLVYLRGKDQEKAKHRRLAQRKHVAGAFRKDDKAEENNTTRNLEEDDRFN
jgi:hypothetical protein